MPCRRADVSAYMAGRLAGARAALPPPLRMFMPAAAQLTIVTDDPSLWRCDDFQGHADGYASGVEVVPVAAPARREMSRSRKVPRTVPYPKPATAAAAAAPRRSLEPKVVVVAQEPYESSSETEETDGAASEGEWHEEI